MGNTEKSNKDKALFAKSINSMISTSEESYNRFSDGLKGRQLNIFTKEEVLETISRGDAAGLRRISISYLYQSGFYRRFIMYYATLLKYSYLLVPHFSPTENPSDEKNMKKYNQALSLISNLKMRNLSKHIAIRVLSEGVYFGLLREYDNNQLAVQDLPYNYCRSRFKNQFGVGIVELKLNYFDTIIDPTVRAEVLKSYPVEIKNAYWNYKNKAGAAWFMISPDKGLYFNLYDERPFFASILPAVIDFQDYREIEKTKDEQDIKNLLVQQMPLHDGELVFDPDEMAEFHKGAVNMLNHNTMMDVITTPANISVESLEGQHSVVTNNLEKIANSIYDEAGVSKQIFSADNNTSLKQSITNDLSLMMLLGEKIACWLEFIINERYSTSKVKFSVSCLPISYYNEDEYRKNAITMAQSGYPFTLAWMAYDLDQQDLNDLKSFEIDGLNLLELMAPLKSSYTAGANDGQTDSAGNVVNEKPDEEKTEKTMQNINSQ